MITKKFSRPWHSLVAAAALFLVSGQVLAHGLTIVAEAVCDETGTLVINYTATSYLPNGPAGAGGGNTRIDIFFNGIKVGQGAFGPVNFSFSGSAPAPAGTSAVVAGTAIDNWDDGFHGGQTAQVTVTYPTEGCVTEPGVGRFTGGGSQIKIGPVRVTRGLTIHCDLLLSNNLEINWNGNRFHMLEHLTTVACTDDPDIIQAPPVAPLDTLIGVGEGRYNNVTGYTVEFTLQDYGEPGRDDRMQILIYQTDNPANVVLDVPLQVLTGGNLQAHYDQPHK